MKREDIRKYISIFILAVMIIAVYKTFDSLGEVFSYIGGFFSLLVPILLAFTIAFILFPLCKKLENIYGGVRFGFVKSHKRGFATATSYIAFLAIVSGFFSVILPALFESITDLIQSLPQIIENVRKYLYSVNFGGYSLKPFLDKITIDEIMTAFNLKNMQSFVSSIAGFSKGILNVFLALIISVYILLDRHSLLGATDKLMSITVPGKHKPIIVKYTNRTFSILYRYIYCQLIDVVIVFVIAFIALSIMGAKYALALALFVGIFNLIPYFGATVACTLAAVITAFTATFSKGILVAIVLIVLQQLDANLIQPKLVKDTLKVRPFWVLCGVTIGGGLFGMLGILLAVPVMALFKTIFEDIYELHTANKSSNTPKADSKSQ